MSDILLWPAKAFSFASAPAAAAAATGGGFSFGGGGAAVAAKPSTGGCVAIHSHTTWKFL